jgi:hypothetical protein
MSSISSVRRKMITSGLAGAALAFLPGSYGHAAGRKAHPAGESSSGTELMLGCEFRNCQQSCEPGCSSSCPQSCSSNCSGGCSSSSMSGDEEILDT